MNNKILSIDDIERCSNTVDCLNNELDVYQQNYSNMINVLQDEEIVQTFFVSGIFGETVKTKLDRVKELLSTFSSSISELTAETKIYLNNQKDLNNRGGF